MPKRSTLTQREMVETIIGVREVAKSLREAASAKPLEGYKKPVVAAQATALVGHADYLDQVAEELLGLVPDVPVKTPPKD